MRYLILFLLLALPARAGDIEIYGRAEVDDGDTLMIGKETIRLLCLDAVELDQTCPGADGRPFPCGEQSKAALLEKIGEDPVRCFGTMRDKYKRLLGWCYAGTVNLSNFVVRQGLAIASCPETRRAEEMARDKNIGIWQGEFIKPKDWRDRHPRPH